MTLSTDVLFLDPVDRDELYKFCNSLVLESSDPESREHETFNETDDSKIINSPGQGYSAWLFVYGNEDGTPAEPGPEHDSYCAEDYEDTDEVCDSWRCTQPYFSRVNFDTAYGYTGPLGETCSMLHAHFIIELGKWATQHNSKMLWVNEYAGTVHQAGDFEALSQFMGNGDSASDWFRNIVMPVIAKEITSGE